MEIRRYSEADESLLFDMMRNEGTDWQCYCGDASIEKYKRALVDSITYLAYEGNTLCGFLRCRDDSGFGVYVYDLLVRKSCRGHNTGRLLMEHVCHEYPGNTVYVMSDADEYYMKQGFRREGSIFAVKSS